jgi:hypothetical protein
MRADPEPNDGVAIDDAHGPIFSAYASGVNGAGGMDGLETQTGMIRILDKRPIRLSGLTLHAGWQLG